MTRDLRRAHRVAWWVLPPVLVVLLITAIAAQSRAQRALNEVAAPEREGAR